MYWNQSNWIISFYLVAIVFSLLALRLLLFFSLFPSHFNRSITDYAVAVVNVELLTFMMHKQITLHENGFAQNFMMMMMISFPTNYSFVRTRNVTASSSIIITIVCIRVKSNLTSEITKKEQNTCKSAMQMREMEFSLLNRYDYCSRAINRCVLSFDRYLNLVCDACECFAFSFRAISWFSAHGQPIPFAFFHRRTHIFAFQTSEWQAATNTRNILND